MVFLVRNMQTDELEVLKLYTPKETKVFLEEVEINQQLIGDSPYLIKMTKFVGASLQMKILTYQETPIEHYSYITLPFCPKGTLIDLLINANKLKYQISLNLQKSLIKQLVEALDFLHTANGLAHLDIKPDNIIIRDDNKLSLIDFGHSKPLNQMVTKTTGTESYMAPEVYRTVHKKDWSSYSAEKADIFSFGVCLFILMFQIPPFFCAHSSDKYY